MAKRFYGMLAGAGLALSLPIAIAQADPRPAEPMRSAPVPQFAQELAQGLPAPAARPPAARPPAARPPATSPPQRYSHGDARKAWRDIGKAQEEAAKVAYLASLTASPAAQEITPIADQLLSQARRDYDAGRYFEARELAKAAKDTYEAAETLYEGELGYKMGRHGPEGPSSSYFDAPFRVNSELARAEAEMEYYRANNPVIADLLRRARAIARPSDRASAQPVAAQDFAYLADNRAAIHLANAAVRLMRAERGF